MMIRKFLLLMVLFGVFLSLAGCAGTVINMPKPMPDIVSTYKSKVVNASFPGMQNTSVRVKEGDYVTIVAKGQIDIFPGKTGYVRKPEQVLLYRIGKEPYVKRYYGHNHETVDKSGNVYLGVADGMFDYYGEPTNPENYRNNTGYFVVDIVVWQKNDPTRITNCFEEISRKDPQNKELVALTEHFKYLRKVLIAKQTTTEGTEEIQKEEVAIKEKEPQEPKEKKAPDVNHEKIMEVQQAGKPPSNQTESIKIKDLSPPNITISSPAIGKEMVVASNEPKMMVVGKVTDESSVEKVTLNKETVTLDQNGQFSASVSLKIGENEINVVAIDSHKNQGSLSFKVIRETVEAKIPQPSPAPKASGKYYGLIIGNNDYRYVSKLEIARRDAVEVEKVLRERYGFETRLLLEATRLAILNAINELRKRLKEEDSVLIYYAGHGYYDAVADKAYWMPVDAERDNPANWIMSDDITTNLKRMTSRHILIVSDSCYSGAFVRSSVANLSSRSDRRHFIIRMLEKTSRTLMSSGGNEPVLDSGGSGHSVFAEAFLKGLKEIEERLFTADELFYEVIRERVIGKSEQTPQYNNIRNSGHEGGDFVFIKK